MPTPLERLTGAEHQLLTLAHSTPDLKQSLEHRLRVFFPRLPVSSRIDNLYLSYEAPPEPGQSPVIVSRTISSLIEACFITQTVPTFVQGATRVYNAPCTLDEQARTSGIRVAQVEKYLEFVMQHPDLCVKEALIGFWQTPHADFDALPPNTWLARFCQNLILSEAALRHEDQTLSSAAKDAIEQMFAPADNRPKPAQCSLGLYQLALKSDEQLGSTTLNGAFMITDQSLLGGSAECSDTPAAADTTARIVVLYTPGNGLETFDSINALTQELSARLNDEPQRKTLLDGVLAQERERAMSLDRVEYQAVTEGIDTFYSEQLIDKQQRDLDHAWRLARAHNKTLSVPLLSEQLHQALIASRVLNPKSILRARYTRLVESRLPLWLKMASDAEKSQWRLAVERLHLERLAADTEQPQPLTGSGEKNTLLGYARTQLKHRIKTDHGIEVDPDQVFISTTEALRTGPVINPISGAGLPSGFPAGASLGRTGPMISYITTRRSLSELALSNVGVWDLTFALTAEITGPTGQRHPTLSSDYLKQLVRQLDIGETYKALLYNLLVNSAQARWRKERYVAFSTAQLRLDLLEAKLAGTLSAEQAAWVQAALDHPVASSRPLVNGAQVVVHQLILRYKPLPGLLVFSNTGSLDLLCYTPAAPNNTWFIKAKSRNELARSLSHVSWRDYVLHRVTGAQQAYIRPLLNQGLSDANVGLQPISQHLFEASYDTKAAHAIRDADEQSTSTWESNLNTAKEAALTVIDVVSFALPVKILLPIALARFTYQIVQGIDALQREERLEALLHFLEAVAHLTDGASDFAGSALFGKTIRQRAKLPPASLNPSAASSRSSSELKLIRGKQYGARVYAFTSTGDGQPAYYLKDREGKLYRAHYDNLDEVWRVIDERQPDALYRLPVREVSAGLWDVDPATALPGQRTGIERVIESARVSDVELASHTSDANGIYHINNNRYIEQSGLIFEVYSGWLGRHWYLQVPGGSSSTHYKVRRTAGHWEIKHRLADTSKRWEPLVRTGAHASADAPAVTHSAYDVPADHNASVQSLIENHPYLLEHYNAVHHAELNKTRALFLELRIKLRAGAQNFFATKRTSPRPLCPEIPANASPKEIFERLYEHSQGLILGESHAEQSGKHMLITHMRDLAANNVKVLYLEHLQTDVHQSHLDALFKTGNISAELSDFLKHQDAGHQVNPHSPYNYSQLVREATKHSIQVKALDCMASYYHQGLPYESNLDRYLIFSYFASQIIRKHQTQAGNPKWIALMGNSHTNRFRGVPGLAELAGAIGLRISDVRPGNGHGLRQNTGAVVAPYLGVPGHSFLKNDYWLEMAIPGTKPTPPALSDGRLEATLSKPGMYLFENNDPLGAHLIHRTSNHTLVRTRLQTDSEGQLFIERENWPAIHLKRYDDIELLKSDLSQLNMRLAR